MAEFAAEVELFEKMGELSLEIQSLQPAWLRDFREAVDADRVFIWGKAPRQPHINGSGERPSFSTVPLSSIWSNFPDTFKVSKVFYMVKLPSTLKGCKSFYLVKFHRTLKGSKVFYMVKFPRTLQGFQSFLYGQISQTP